MAVRYPDDLKKACLRALINPHQRIKAEPITDFERSMVEAAVRLELREMHTPVRVDRDTLHRCYVSVRKATPATERK
jgi:hypothetical protein